MKLLLSIIFKKFELPIATFSKKDIGSFLYKKEEAMTSTASNEFPQTPF